MDDVTRYVCYVNTGELAYDEHPNGAWVDYEDHKAIVEIKDNIIEALSEEVANFVRNNR